MLRCVQADSMMFQTCECKSIEIWLSLGLDQLGEDQISVPAAFFTGCHNHTHTRIPHGLRASRPKPARNTTWNCHREKTGRKMSTPSGWWWSAYCPTHTHFLTGGCWAVSTHMRPGGSIIAPRIADCLIGRRRGQNELAARMK